MEQNFPVASHREAEQTMPRYTVYFLPEADGGYSVIVPALPGCNTQGDTFEEAERNAREAIQVYLESLVADGEAIPEEHDLVLKQIRVPLRPAGYGA